MADTDYALIQIAHDDAHEFWIEFHAGRVWMHQTVHRCIPRVLRDTKRIIAELQERYGDLWVCDNDYALAPNLPRYLNIYGFQPCELIPHAGMIRTCFVKRNPNG